MQLLQDRHKRTFQRTHKMPLPVCTWTSPKKPLMREFTLKMPQTKTLRTRRGRLRASLRNQNTHGLLTKTILCKNLHQGSERSVWTHWLGNLQENAAPQDGDSPVTHILYEPAQSKCIWTSRKSHFVGEVTGKMLCPRSEPQVLCEPAQSKCIWISRKSHCMR